MIQCNHPMKKILLLLIIPVLVSTSFAAKTFKVTVQVIDGYTNKPYPKCKVLVSDDAVINNTKIADEHGKVTFHELGKKSLSFWAYPNDYRFHDGNIAITNRSMEDTEVIIYLYPTSAYEQAILNREDSLYGSVKKDSTSSSSENNKICQEFDIEPEFEGGFEGMSMFIHNNVQYPSLSLENGEQGKVYVSFVVEADGRVSHVKVERGVSKLLDLEAKRIIRSMPLWKPGSCQYGSRCVYRLPINFALR